MSRLVPAAVRDRVVASIAAEAESADWDHLPQADKTTLLGRWVSADAVGGVLRPLLGTDADVRLWITDVALKRRARTLLPAADAVARSALGDDAHIRPGSVGLKPFHCDVEVGDKRFYLCWDRVENVRHLIWAAMSAREDNPNIEDWIVAIVEKPPTATSPNVRRRLERIAGSAGLSLRWINAE
jgi:hypothetical protein